MVKRYLLLSMLGNAIVQSTESGDPVWCINDCKTMLQQNRTNVTECKYNCNAVICLIVNTPVAMKPF